MVVLAGLVLLGVAALVVMCVLSSIKTIGPTEVGLVTKRFGLGKLGDDNPIALKGEAGYQAKLLMPGLRFKLWPMGSPSASEADRVTIHEYPQGPKCPTLPALPV